MKFSKHDTWNKTSSAVIEVSKRTLTTVKLRNKFCSWDSIIGRNYIFQFSINISFGSLYSRGFKIGSKFASQILSLSVWGVGAHRKFTVLVDVHSPFRGVRRSLTVNLSSACAYRWTRLGGTSMRDTAFSNSYPLLVVTVSLLSPTPLTN